MLVVALDGSREQNSFVFAQKDLGVVNEVILLSQDAYYRFSCN